MILESGSDYPRFHRYHERAISTVVSWPEQDSGTTTVTPSCNYDYYSYTSTPTLVADVEEEEQIPQSIWIPSPILIWKGSRSAFRKFEIIRIRSPTK